MCCSALTSRPRAPAMRVALPSFSVLFHQEGRRSIATCPPRSVAVTTSVCSPSGSLSKGILIWLAGALGDDALTVEHHLDERRAGRVGRDHVGLRRVVGLDLLDAGDHHLGRRRIDEEERFRDVALPARSVAVIASRVRPSGSARARARRRRRRRGSARGACPRWRAPWRRARSPAERDRVGRHDGPALQAAQGQRRRHRVDGEVPALREARPQQVGCARRDRHGVGALREVAGREVEALGVAAHDRGHVASVEAHGEGVQALGAGQVDTDEERVAGLARARARRDRRDARRGDELEGQKGDDDGRDDDRDDPEAMMRCERDDPSSTHVLTRQRRGYRNRRRLSKGRSVGAGAALAGVCSAS